MESSQGTAGSGGRGRSRALGLVALGLVGFLGTARLAARIEGPLPFPDHLWHRKLDALVAAAERGGVDTVVVGSSLVYRHVDPFVFDRTMAEAGRPTRSFNLGLPGMTPHELDLIVDRLCELDPEGLRSVWISPPWLSLETRPSPRGPREVNVHDPERLLVIARLIAASELSLPDKLSVGLAHAVVSARNVLRVGMGYEDLRRRLAGTASDRERAAAEADAELREMLGPHGDGFEALVVSGDDKLLLRRASIWAKGGKRDFLRALRERRRDGPPDVAVPGGLDALLERLATRVRGAGWEPVFFTHPLVSPDQPDAQYVHLWRPPDGSLVLDLSDPERYPELFDLDLHFDLMHLNAPGAQLFTERLAHAYLAASAR